MAGYQCPLCGRDARDLGPHPEHPRKLIRRVGCETCGEYFLTEVARHGLEYLRREPQKAAMISAVTRERAEQGSPITICSSSYDPRGEEPIGVRVREILETMAPRSIPERLDRALLNLARKSRYPGDVVPVDAKTDYPLMFSEGPQSVDFMLSQMERSGLLDKATSFHQGGGSYTVTVPGWTKVDELTRPGAQRPPKRSSLCGLIPSSTTYTTPGSDRASKPPGIAQSVLTWTSSTTRCATAWSLR